MPAEFIYTTYRLARHYPPDRTVLEDISLSFYPGAKIGVIGPNGAGKSSLLPARSEPSQRTPRRVDPDRGPSRRTIARRSPCQSSAIDRRSRRDRERMSCPWSVTETTSSA
jgi:ATPase subunit of ABC transporter with duplicated ATPase domains